MIRERRNKEKLASYYKKFMDEGIVDPNVHPWVAESWLRCRALNLPHETMPKINKLSREEIVEHQKTHEFIVKYVDGLYEQSKQHFNIHNLSMLLIDENGYVIKNGIKLNVKLVKENETIAIDLDANAKFSNINGSVSIKIPTGDQVVTAE